MFFLVLCNLVHTHTKQEKSEITNFVTRNLNSAARDRKIEGSVTCKDGCSNNLKARCRQKASKKKKKKTSEEKNASEGCFRCVEQRWGRGRKGVGGGWRREMSFEQPPASQCSVNKVRASLGKLGLNSNHNKKVNRVIPVR